MVTTNSRCSDVHARLSNPSGGLLHRTVERSGRLHRLPQPLLV